MKKIFTLLAVAAMAFSASAQNEYKASGEEIAAGTVLVDNDLLKITALSTSKGGLENKPICGVEFTGWFQLRTDNPDPTPDEPTPGVTSGSTGISVEAKSNVDLSAYYRRQLGSGSAHNPGDNKDLLCKNLTTGEMVTNVLTLDDEADATASYAYVKSTYTLTPGNYMLYRRGSTMRCFGFTWVAGDTSAITEIAADENAPVEYFNLQGMRVENPANGLFIKRQGSKVSKVIIK